MTARSVLQGAFGRAGLYSGTRVIGFEMADGNVGALGAQWQWAPQWTGAASFLATHGRIVPDDQGEAVFEQGDTQALYAATAWQGARDRVQFNLLGSNGDSVGSATGGWIDASAVRGRYLHNYGVYRLDEGLSWGALPINNDVEGGYYRIGYQYARWSWNVGLDSLRSLSGDGFDGQFATGYLRYQASSTLGYGGSLNLRDAASTGHSAQLFLDKRTDWGQSRMQLDQAGSEGRPTAGRSASTRPSRCSRARGCRPRSPTVRCATTTPSTPPARPRWRCTAGAISAIGCRSTAARAGPMARATRPFAAPISTSV